MLGSSVAQEDRNDATAESGQVHEIQPSSVSKGEQRWAQMSFCSVGTGLSRAEKR